MKTARKPERGIVAFESHELAQIEVASSELTRDINRDTVLERIRALQPISRVDLARASGLQPSTVSSIVEQLLRELWIRESAMVKTARGRRPTLLFLNDEVVFLVADVRRTQATVAVVDLNGRFLDRRTVPLSKFGERSVDLLTAQMQHLRSLYAHLNFRGVGVSLPGRVDPRTNQLVFAPNLHWELFDIQARLGKMLGLEVQLENSANVCLLSELWFGKVEGIRNAVIVTISEGIGVAILVDGRLISGQQGLAGEFGHICVDPSGPNCGCGARGCWEVFASSRAAIRYYLELEPEASSKSMIELVSLAIDGDPSANRALLRHAHAIGQGLHLLNAVLSPEVLLLSGDFTTFYEIYREVIEAECRAGAMDGVGPRVVSIGDGESTRLRGAAAVVLQRHSGYYRASHMRVQER